MRRVIFSSVLLATLLAVVTSGPSQVGASTSNSSAQLTYSASHEPLQDLGVVNLSAASAATASAGSSGGGTSTPAGRHPVNIDRVDRPVPSVAGAATMASAPTMSVNTSSSGRLPGFAGVSGPQQAAVNGGGDLEPPDQGTCAGPGANGTVVVDIVNNALSMYTPGGSALLPVTPTYALFNQPSTAFLSDPRCSYDSATQRWFFTEFVVGSASAKPKKNFAPSTQFVAVSTTSDPLGSYHVFGVDTTDLSNPVGDCPCFGDYDMVGFDANGIYITTNEFSTGNTAPGFNGTVMYAISKQELAAAADGASLPLVARYAITGDAFGSGGGNQPYHISPATTPPGGGYAPDTEYFVESNSNASTDSHLIVYALTNTQTLAEGATPPLQATEISSEPYAFPPNATQAPGTLTLGPGIGTLLGNPYFNTTSPQGIQNDFNAVQEVTYTDSSLYAELDTASSTGAAPTSAAAWFRITPSLVGGGVSAQMANQGYVATSQNIMYPDIVVGAKGNGYLAFSVSGSNTYPSAGFTTFNANSGPQGPVNIEAAGAAPEDGFTCYISGYGGCRWGDYSGGAVWAGQAYMMTEYIAPTSQRDTFTNWGTFVWSGPAQ